MIEIKVADRVATVTIARVEAHNALDSHDLERLRLAIRDCVTRPDVGAIIITGAGSKSFVAGGDIGDLNVDIGAGAALDLPMQPVFEAIAGSPKPTIAAVNGYALGGGFELALACDIRICADTASFGLPELGWSVLPAAGGVTRLTRLIGPGRALELILTGRRVSAAEALGAGIVTSVTTQIELLAEAHALAQRVLTKAPVAVRIARLTVALAAESSTSSALTAERLGLAALYGTSDKAEGTSAFFEKRAPNFQGK